jgi:hypothetical protein
MLELYPWHSRSAKGLIRPSVAALDEFIWAPLAELDVRTVFSVRCRLGSDGHGARSPAHRPLAPGQLPLGIT